jgi:hypothetical protein
MKLLHKLLLLIMMLPFTVMAQTTDLKPVEPQQTSFTNKDLILIALAAFALLVAIYFLFRRAKNRR